MPSHGGIERVLHERARGFRPETVTVFTPWVAGSTDFDRNSPYKIKRAKFFCSALPYVRRVFQALMPAIDFLRNHRKNPFDVIECGQAFPFSFLAWLLWRRDKIPYVVWVHGNDLLAPRKFPLLGRALADVLKNASVVICNSSFVADLVRKAGVDSSRIRILGHFVDAERFKPKAPSPTVIRKYNLEGKKVILSVCRLIERKGIDRVIEVLPSLITTHPDLVYLIVGRGPMENILRTTVSSRHLERHVIFVGAVTDEELVDFYSVARCFVMVSRYIPAKATVEGLGVVYLEANACGIPVVAGRSGGVTDVVRHRENGLLVDPDSREEIAQALDLLLSNEEMAKSLGKTGHEFTLKPTNWNIFDVPVPERVEAAVRADDYRKRAAT